MIIIISNEKDYSTGEVLKHILLIEAEKKCILKTKTL